MSDVDVLAADVPRTSTNVMGTYRIVARRFDGNEGVEIIVGGPGIPRSGVSYWFESEGEVESFIENLNLSYLEAKRLASWRKEAITGADAARLRI